MYCCPEDKEKRVIEKSFAIGDPGTCFIKCDPIRFRETFKSYDCYKYWETLGCGKPTAQTLGCTNRHDCKNVCTGKNLKKNMAMCEE